MIEKLNTLVTRGTVSDTNPSGTWSTWKINMDISMVSHDKINELVDAVNLLQAKGGSGGGTDANILLEIIKENNKQWMELLKFMKDMKLEVPK